MFKIPYPIALFLSLLIIFTLGTYSINALSKFYNYQKLVNPNMELTVDRFHFFLKNEFKREWIKLTASEPLSDEESLLKTFRITVKQKDIDTLNSDLPKSGKEQYVDGLMQVSDDKGIRKIQLRYRGDTNLHWLYHQKSLRIKLPKNNIYNMEMKFNLVNTVHSHIIMDQVAYTLAKEIGLISPSFHPVRVFINGTYMGVYMYLSQVDESLLRKYKIMPGSIYYGDGSPANAEGMADLWFNPEYWQKKAARNAEQKNIREDINYFIEMLNNASKNEFFKFFNTFTDKDKFLKFMALDVLFGGIHHDLVHNHKIYFDPYRGKFQPFAWDLRYWTSHLTKDTSMYPLIEKIKLNPLLEYERDLMIYKLYKKYTPDKIVTLLDTFSHAQYNDLKSDIYRDTGTLLKIIPNEIAIPFSMKGYTNSIEGLKNVYKKRYSYLSTLIDDSRVKYKKEKTSNDYNKYTVYISGNTPVIISCNNYKITLDTNFNGKKDKNDSTVNSTILYPGKQYKDGNAIHKSIFKYGTKHLVPSRLKYIIFVKKEFNDLVIKNALTKNPVIPKEVSEDYNIKSNSIHPWKLPKENHRTKILHGIIEVDSTLIFDQFTTVKVEPNTTFIMDENTSIYFYGKVTAIGTKDKPIKFIAKDPKKPWGLVAVQGKATTGSKFEYVEFENGSIDTHNLIHYTSPFNIHDMDWFEVRNCKIGRNFIGDDAMHIAYSKGIVDSCEFTNARSDGLDIDISDVNITNNIFYKSGNDGLDIMTTTMHASNNIFIDMGDKGISVGEWSEANITDTFFLRTLIGIEIKDKSKVTANNLVYVDTKEKAINLYNKNKRYDTGGLLEAKNIYLLGNTKVKTDKRSSQKIKNKVENILPDLTQYQWYHTIQNTQYKKFVDDVEVKYAK